MQGFGLPAAPFVGVLRGRPPAVTDRATGQAGRGAAAHRIAGALAAAPGATELAWEAALLLDRYVREVVLAFRLCPFLSNPDAALGAVVVVMDPTPDEATLEEIVATSDTPVMHVLYPLASGDSPSFERFASRVGTRLRARMGRAAPVSAAFHPTMHGETDDAHRLIGLLRHAPHAFVQYVPADVTQGMGTTIAGAPAIAAAAAPVGAEANFARLCGRSGELPRVLAVLAELHATRDAVASPLVTRVLASAAGGAPDDAGP